MRPFRTCLSLAFLGLFLTSSSQILAAEPAATADRFAAAMATGDREGVLACLAPEVVIFEHGGAELSRDEYAAHHLGGDLEYLKTLKIRVVERRVLPGKDHAIILTRSEATGGEEGNPEVSKLTETLVLERHGEDWLIVHIHWSSRKSS